MRPIPSLAAALLLGIASAHAGVLVVDAANGPGTDFTSLSTAISAAQNGDLLLMRSGTYDGEFRILDKAISIVADAGANVVVTNSLLAPTAIATLEVTGTIPGTVVLRDLTLTAVLPSSGPFSQSPLRINPAGAAAHVFIEGCLAPSRGGGGFWLEGNAPITVSRCAGQGTDGAFLALGGEHQAQAGITLFSGQVAMFASAFRGGDGRDAVVSSASAFSGAVGAPGLRIFTGLTSQSLFSDSPFEGGMGGDGLQAGATCLAPGNGGAGIESVFGTAHVVQTAGVGGPPGTPVPSCGQTGQTGNAISVTFLGQPPIPLAGQPGRAITPPPRREGEATTITVEGPPSHTAFLVVGYAPTRVFAPQFAGVLATTPSAILALGNLPPSGAIPLSTFAPTLPVGVESAMAYVQPITQHPTTGQATLGAPSVLVVLDAGL